MRDEKVKSKPEKHSIIFFWNVNWPVKKLSNPTKMSADQNILFLLSVNIIKDVQINVIQKVILVSVSSLNRQHLKRKRDKHSNS